MKDAEEPQEIEIVYLEDPVWDPAIEALQKRGDGRGIADLLKQEVPMPTYIGRELGIMIDPPEGYRGTRLHVSGKTIASRQAALRELREKRLLRQRILELERDMKTEAAIALVAKETGLKRTALFEIKRFDGSRAMRKSDEILGIAANKKKRGVRRKVSKSPD